MRSRAERYNRCRAELFDLERAGKVQVIAPEDTLGVGRTERNIDKLMTLYAQGYAVTMQQRPMLEQYLGNGQL